MSERTISFILTDGMLGCATIVATVALAVVMIVLTLRWPAMTPSIDEPSSIL